MRSCSLSLCLDSLPWPLQHGTAPPNKQGSRSGSRIFRLLMARQLRMAPSGHSPFHPGRSEEHTSELQSREKLVCRLLLEKNKQSLATSLLPSTNLGLPPRSPGGSC